MRILLVEDDEILSAILQEFLTDQLYVVDVVRDGEAAWKQAKTIEYALILLDLMLPKLDGIHLCKRLRAHKIQTPILIVTARDTRTDKITGLDAGADDYLVKPFDLEELMARMRALLRRGSTSLPPILEWGELRLNPALYQVSYREQPLRLTSKEYSLLELLLRNGQRVYSRSLIIEQLWSQENPPDEGTVKAHIGSLRKKLRALGAPSDFIETVHGTGYRLKQLSTPHVS
jgi:DNA-binding response OmpR family regulator